MRLDSCWIDLAVFAKSKDRKWQIGKKCGEWWPQLKLRSARTKGVEETTIWGGCVLMDGCLSRRFLICKNAIGGRRVPVGNCGIAECWVRWFGVVFVCGSVRVRALETDGTPFDQILHDVCECVSVWARLCEEPLVEGRKSSISSCTSRPKPQRHRTKMRVSSNQTRPLLIRSDVVCSCGVSLLLWSSGFTTALPPSTPPPPCCSNLDNKNLVDSLTGPNQ